MVEPRFTTGVSLANGFTAGLAAAVPSEHLYDAGR